MAHPLKRGPYTYEIVSGEILESQHQQETTFSVRHPPVGGRLNVSSTVEAWRENWVKTPEGRQVLVTSAGEVPLRAGLHIRALCAKTGGTYQAVRIQIDEMQLVHDAIYQVQWMIFPRFLLVLMYLYLVGIFFGVGFEALLYFFAGRPFWVFLCLAFIVANFYVVGYLPWKRYWAWARAVLP